MRHGVHEHAVEVRCEGRGRRRRFKCILHPRLFCSFLLILVLDIGYSSRVVSIATHKHRLMNRSTVQILEVPALLDFRLVESFPPSPGRYPSSACALFLFPAVP